MSVHEIFSRSFQQTWQHDLALASNICPDGVVCDTLLFTLTNIFGVIRALAPRDLSSVTVSYGLQMSDVPHTVSLTKTVYHLTLDITQLQS